MRSVINKTVKTIRISATQNRCTIFIFTVKTVEYYLGNLCRYFSRFNRLIFNSPVDFLFLIRQENIGAFAASLHQCLSDKPFQSVLDFLLKFHSVLIDIRCHKTCNIFDSCTDFFDILYHKQNFQHIYIKTIFILFGIDFFISECFCDNTSMGMVNKFFQSIVKQIKRYDCSKFLVFEFHGTFLE